MLFSTFALYFNRLLNFTLKFNFDFLSADNFITIIWSGCEIKYSRENATPSTLYVVFETALLISNSR